MGTLKPPPFPFPRVSEFQGNDFLNLALSPITPPVQFSVFLLVRFFSFSGNSLFLHRFAFKDVV